MPHSPPLKHPASQKIRIIGLGEDGWLGLNAKAQDFITQADTLIGGKRHLDLLPNAITQGKKLQSWPSPLKPFLHSLIIEYLHGSPPFKKIAILASGNPMLYGIGASFQDYIPWLIAVIPHISTQTLICAHMGWSEQRTTLISLCGRPLEQINAHLYDKERLIILSNDNTSPRQVAQLLLDKQFGDSDFTLFENIGGKAEKITYFCPSDLLNKTNFSNLNAIAIQLSDAPHNIHNDAIHTLSLGLPETAFQHDDQITKKEIRTITLAALSPRPNQYLIDLGSGSGSIAIEWMRAAPNARATAVEPRADRIENIKFNAKTLGTPSLEVVKTTAQTHMDTLWKVNAIFIGGGLTDSPDLISLCLKSLLEGGRLVSNAVTLQSEALLFQAYKEFGGTLTRIEIAKPDQIGKFDSWKPTRPVTQWCYIKPYTINTRFQGNAPSIKL